MCSKQGFHFTQNSRFLYDKQKISEGLYMLSHRFPHPSWIEIDLHQLWRRIVFNIAISNTDDHLRNHGFILKSDGWHLSPAFDINPSIDKAGLAINIDSENNALDFDLALHVGDYFQLTKNQMQQILDEVLLSVSSWQTVAKSLGISMAEQEMMEAAFRY